MENIAVFASGSGSNFQAIMEDFAENPLAGARVRLLVCDNPQAGVLKRASNWPVECRTFPYYQYETKGSYEQAILTCLQAMQIRYIVLAGYMRIVGPSLLAAYLGRIINVHPSLLPAFPGQDAIVQALDYGVRVTGVTVHFIDAGIDTGPIIAQEAVSIPVHSSYEELANRIHQVEHRILPEVIRAMVKGEIRLQGGRTRWVAK